MLLNGNDAELWSVQAGDRRVRVSVSEREKAQNVAPEQRAALLVAKLERAVLDVEHNMGGTEQLVIQRLLPEHAAFRETFDAAGALICERAPVKVAKKRVAKKRAVKS